MNYNSYVPGMKYPGIEEFLQRYAEARRGGEGRSARLLPAAVQLRHRPDARAGGRTPPRASTTRQLAAYLHKNEMKTIVGPISCDKNGEWANPRVVQAQFRGVADKDIEQFRQPGKQVVVYPDAYKTGDVITPFEKAR